MEPVINMMFIFIVDHNCIDYGIMDSCIYYSIMTIL